MSRWRKALIAASVGMAASAAYVVTSSIPGEAQASLVADYHCTGGIAGGGVDLEARMTPQVEAGTMNVRWDMSYKNVKQFGSPGFFVPGSSLNLEGVVDISGAWLGQLRPRGGQEQDELVPGDYLDLPEGLSDSASLTRSGTIRFKPTTLTVRFTPAEGEVMVNNNRQVTYAGAWTHEYTAPEYSDFLHDVQKTSEQGAVAKLEFFGTKVAYIGRRAPNLGPIRVILDGEAVTDPLVEPGLDRSGNAMTGTETEEVLWESPQLEYKKHTIEVVNTEAKDAYLDAFQVITGDIPEPPALNQAVCALQGDPGAIDITVPGATPTQTDDPTDEPPTDNPTDNPTSTSTATNTAPQGNTTTIGPGNVIVVPRATGSGSATPKATGPTATRYYKAQIPQTPKGGVDSGEAPDPGDQPYGLMTSGAALVMGSAGGGLLLRRRRAAHAGGAK
ncbi:hypothetical protein ACFLIM_38210 [Nonomuraea sp. M3C6]|uniref:Gram-positive cocci surface proteins LPxTG domain-containing protein n=1 Tax=Nonomuraea marmarensis TaxID=3351344 RepID=A0ABW7AS20_9ACTN